MCHPKTMLKFGAALFAALAVLFAALPEFRTWTVGSGPLLLALLCPLHMLYCMLTMKKKPAPTLEASSSALPAPSQQDLS